jgi:hypothetical protein
MATSWSIFLEQKLLFPLVWIESVLLKNIDESTAAEQVTIGELFRWIGLWIYMDPGLRIHR